MPNYSTDVSDPAYMDKLPRLKRRLPPGVIEIMRRAMTVDDLAWSVVSVVAFALNMQDRRPSDFAVVIEDAQDIVWDDYAFPGMRPPVGPCDPKSRHNLRLVFGDDGGFRVDADHAPNSGAGRVHTIVDRPGRMARRH